jgi:hypothetical protein
MTAMKAIRETIVQATLILIMLNLFGCSGGPAIAPGDSIPLQPGATSYGLAQARAGADLTAKALTNGKDAVVAWSGPGQCWSCIVIEKGAPANGAVGQAMNAADMSDFMRWIYTVLGWARVPASSISPMIVPIGPGLLVTPEVEPQS